MSDAEMEKKICTIPPVRVDEPLYLALTQHVMGAPDRSQADVVRDALRMYLEAHGRIVSQHPGDGK